MNVLFWILISTVLISLVSFVGAATLVLKRELLRKILMILVSLSAGVLMGAAFLDLIIEASETMPQITVFIFTLIGFIAFFFIEKILQWRHCHDEKCAVHAFAYVNLYGDAVHNFVDGIIIAASFIANLQLGLITTFAVALHEIPQELGEFGVLIYGGFKASKALLFNFISALAAILGGVLGYFLSSYLKNQLVMLLPFAAGGFIYIAASDLIPEIRKEINLKKSFVNMVVFVIGILIVYSLKVLI